MSYTRDAVTEQAIGAEDFRRLRSTAILVNTTRSALIDEAALFVTPSRIAAAALHCSENESAAHPFRMLYKVIATPHSGYVACETGEMFFADVVENIEAFIVGRPIHLFA